MKVKFKSGSKISNPENCAKILRGIMACENRVDQDKEHFWVLGLNSNYNIKYIELASLGILNQSLVHPREVFRLAIFEGVVAIIVAHNHPSGAAEPSKEDVLTIDNLYNAGKIIGINVLDHIIITNTNYYSFREHGYFDK